MKLTHLIGIGVVAGGGAWFLMRQAERRKLERMLANSPQVKAMALANKVYSIAGDKRYANYTPEALASYTVKITNTISAEDGYVQILNNLPSPEALEAKEGILDAETYQKADAASRAITGKGLEELEKEVGDTVADTIGTSSGEGILPDALPVIGTKEKLAWWKSWFGDAQGMGGWYVG
jgi:hypothetical protein